MHIKYSLLLCVLLGVGSALTFAIVCEWDCVSYVDAKSKNVHSVENIYGIDVSHHQGEINWDKVKKWKNEELEFVYIKATEGATYIDQEYAKNFAGARENGLLAGSYHYFRTTSSVENQFRNFTENIQIKEQDLIPMIDVEEKINWGENEFHANLQEFLQKVENYFGKKPMIYSVNSFYNMNLSGRYQKYHFLIGRYGTRAPNMRDNTNWTVWQFTETGIVEGIPKDVDVDVLNRKYSLNDILLQRN